MNTKETRRAAERAAPPHPDQPMYLDGNIVRFRSNPIVDFLLGAGPFDMNALAAMPFDPEDRAQFAQLIGYSVSGWGDLSYVPVEGSGRCDLASLKMMDVLAYGENPGRVGVVFRDALAVSQVLTRWGWAPNTDMQGDDEASWYMQLPEGGSLHLYFDPVANQPDALLVAHIDECF